MEGGCATIIPPRHSAVTLRNKGSHKVTLAHTHPEGKQPFWMIYASFPDLPGPFKFCQLQQLPFITTCNHCAKHFISCVISLTSLQIPKTPHSHLPAKKQGALWLANLSKAHTQGAATPGGSEVRQSGTRDQFLGSAPLALRGAFPLTAFDTWEPRPLLVYQPEGGDFQIMTISVHSSKIY